MTTKQTTLSIAPASQQKTLSKAQKKFNTLIKKIEQQKQQLREWQDMQPVYERKVAEDYQPLWHEQALAKIAFVNLLDRAHDDALFKKRDKSKLAHLINEIIESVLDYPDFHEQIKALYNKYQQRDFDADQQEQAAENSVLMQNLFKEMFDIDMPDLDVNNPQAAEAILRETVAEKMRQEEEREQQAQERASRRKKSAKQLEKEAKQQEHIENISKSIQEVYRKLVKTLHPDREPDAAERQRKTELMQKVNIAYEKKDLLQLLELQLEVEQIDQNHLNNIAEERLLYFNKILQEQSNELSDEVLGMEQAFAMRAGLPPFQSISPRQVLQALERDIRDLKHNFEEIKVDTQTFQDFKRLKDFLKSYTIPKRISRFEEDFDPFAELDMMFGRRR